MALAYRYAPEFGLRDAERSLTAMESNRSEAGHIADALPTKLSGCAGDGRRADRQHR